MIRVFVYELSRIHSFFMAFHCGSKADAAALLSLTRLIRHPCAWQGCSCVLNCGNNLRNHVIGHVDLDEETKTGVGVQAHCFNASCLIMLHRLATLASGENAFENSIHLKNCYIICKNMCEGFCSVHLSVSLPTHRTD